MVKKGDKVAVHYKGTLNDGSVFDSSEGREPLEFQVGSGMVIKGFDDGVTGMEIGEKKTIHIPAADAYGSSNEDLIFSFDRADIPAHIPLEIGKNLNLHSEQGTMSAVIREVSEHSIKLDANHPMAGLDLNFELELVSIK